MKTLDKYMQEVEADTKLDVFNVKDVQSKLPGIKHKWVGRLIRHKCTRDRLFQELEDKKKYLIKAVAKESGYNVSKPAAAKAVEQHESVVDIKKQISDEKMIITFLEKIERIFNSMTFDIKNLTEIMKLETM